MYLDLDSVRAPLRPIEVCAEPAWSVLVPFFNERDYLADTIAGLAAQSVPLRLILIDNGSTDGSAEVARAACRAHGLDHLLIVEHQPGKVAALRAGLGWVRTRHVATCDADTLYPPQYLAEAGRLLAEPGCVATGAFFVAPDADVEGVDARARKVALAARMLPRQCHTGGAGQAFRTATLRAAGGFDPDRWGYVLEDHEVIHRVMRRGAMRYAPALWCVPSPRERDRASIRWTLLERLVYSATAPWAGDWFFYRFLAPRLRQRRLLSRSIRERQYQEPEGSSLGTPHPVF